MTCNLKYDKVLGTFRESDSVEVDDQINQSPTVVQNSVDASGGLLINIDSADGDISRTTSGWIEDNEALGWYAVDFTGWTSFEYDTDIIRTWRTTLKLSTTDVSGRARGSLIAASNYVTTDTNLANASKLIKIKPNVNYRLSCFVKTDNVATDSVFIEYSKMSASYAQSVTWTTNKLSWTNSWTILTTEFNSTSNEYLGITLKNDVAGNISDAWFDINSMKLEEIVEYENNNETEPNEANIAFTATSREEILEEGSTNTDNLESIHSSSNAGVRIVSNTKQKITTVSPYLIKFGTSWDITCSVYKWDTDYATTITGSVLATETIDQTDISSSARNDFTVPFLAEEGESYLFHFTGTGAGSGNEYKIRGNTTSNKNSNLEVYWNGVIVNSGNSEANVNIDYALQTTELGAKLHTNEISLKSDGFMNGSVIDIKNGKFLWKWKQDYLLQTDLYEYTSPTGTNSLANFYASDGSIGGRFAFYGSTTGGSASWKVQTGWKLNGKIGVLTGGLSVGNTNSVNVKISADWVTYTTIGKSTEWSVDTNYIFFESDLIQGQDYFYVKLDSTDTGDATDYRMVQFEIKADIDTSEIQDLINYPTNLDLVDEYEATTDTSVTRCYYYEDKYGYPNITFNDGTNDILAIPLDLDTTGESITVEGSTLDDGEYVEIASTTNPVVTVTANIPYNRLRISSNNYNNNGAITWSGQQTVNYSVYEQGLIYDINEIKSDINLIKSESLGSQPINQFAVNSASETIDSLPTGESIISVPYTATGAVTITISSAQIRKTGWKCGIKDTWGNAFTNPITIATQWSETVDWEVTLDIDADYASKVIYSDGYNLFVI